ncbi:MAG: lipid-A-disaccharide synthase [Bryobacteraceae bacterium]
MVPLKILVSAGEASGDLYAAGLVERLRRRIPDAEFFGCAGHHMERAGVRPVVRADSLAVVGLLEVVAHIPRIYREFHRLIDAARREKPDLAILADSPDFHLRVAKRLKSLGIPVVYLVAPQVWAWRERRISSIRRNIDRLLCIFPFEERYFQRHGVPAEYIGHPLSRIVKPSLTREAFFERHHLNAEVPVVVLLPGSRQGEITRHLPRVLDAVNRIRSARQVQFLLAVPPGLLKHSGRRWLDSLLGDAPVRIVEGETWDAIAHADVALAASGTVTVEVALLGTPMVTYYRVTALSWLLGKFLVDVPFYSMVNLVAGRAVVKELMQNEMRGDRLAAEVMQLLDDRTARQAMQSDLQSVAALLSTGEDPLERAAAAVQQLLDHGA